MLLIRSLRLMVGIMRTESPATAIWDVLKHALLLFTIVLKPGKVYEAIYCSIFGHS